MGGRHSQFHFDDSDTDVNKLICIVLKAGLEPTCKVGKQALEDLEGQIVDCLDIIQVAVEKAPQALTQASDPGILGESVDAPLYAWLILRLISFINTWDNQRIKDVACDTISTIVYPQSRQVRSLPLCHPISTFLRACITGWYSPVRYTFENTDLIFLDILVSIDASLARVPGNFDAIRPSIPTSKGTIFLDLDRLGLPHGLFVKDISLGTFWQAALLTLRLLDIFNPSFKTCLHTTGKGYVIRQDLSWALNGYQRLWRAVSSWTNDSGPDAMQASMQISTQFARCVRRFCKEESSLPSSMTSTWLHALADLLTLDNLSQNPALQFELGHLLDSLAETSDRPQIFFRRMGNIIFPTLIQIKDTDAALDSFEPFFKVVNSMSKFEKCANTNQISDRNAKASRQTCVRTARGF